MIEIYIFKPVDGSKILGFFVCSCNFSMTCEKYETMLLDWRQVWLAKKPLEPFLAWSWHRRKWCHRLRRVHGEAQLQVGCGCGVHTMTLKKAVDSKPTPRGGEVSKIRKLFIGLFGYRAFWLATSLFIFFDFWRHITGHRMKQAPRQTGVQQQILNVPN